MFPFEVSYREKGECDCPKVTLKACHLTKCNMLHVFRYDEDGKDDR